MIKTLLESIGCFLCGLRLHAWEYDVTIEHGIIDGPPRVFAKVVCSRCGFKYVSRLEADVEKAKAAARKRGQSSVWWY